MKQRLGIARVLLHDPKVLILDEPASDLDPRARIEMRDLLLELRELGKTIFLSSHILTELSDVCTAIGILERGRLVVAGPIGEIAERLEHQRAAQAVGIDPGQAPPVAPQAFSAPGALPVAAPPIADTGPSTERMVDPAVAATPPVTTAGGVAIPSAARKRLKLRVLGDSRQVMPLIAGGGGVLGVEAGLGGQLLVHYVGDDRFVADVVRHLVAHGVGIVGCEPERNELERIFLEVTRGDLQ
jgi:ABC-2 type transport system ATP-binding protein